MCSVGNAVKASVVAAKTAAGVAVVHKGTEVVGELLAGTLGKERIKAETPATRETVRKPPPEPATAGLPAPEGWVQGIDGPRKETAKEKAEREKYLAELDQRIAPAPAKANSKGATK